jgi:integrase
MRWSQLDLESGLWDLGTLDTKNERLKRTPLPRQALAYLREAYESRVNDEFVFPGRSLAKPISNMTMLKHLKESEESVVAPETVRPSFSIAGRSIDGSRFAILMGPRFTSRK